MEPFLDKGVIRVCESVVLRREFRELVEGHGPEIRHALGTIERACQWLTTTRGWSDEEAALLVAYAAALLGRPRMAKHVEGYVPESKDLGDGFRIAERFLDSGISGLFGYGPYGDDPL